MPRRPAPTAPPQGPPRRYGFERHPRGSVTVVALAAATTVLLVLTQLPTAIGALTGPKDFFLCLAISVALAALMHHGVTSWLEQAAFMRWARKTYSYSLAREQAAALLRGRPTAEFSVAYERGRLYLHAAAGELQVTRPGVGEAAPVTQELPVVGRGVL